MTLILGLMDGKPCAAGSCKVLLLKHFIDVLKDSFRGKQFTYRTDPGARVPENSLSLWRKRGYQPARIGTAYVTFEGIGKEYCYPCYFWSE